MLSSVSSTSSSSGSFIVSISIFKKFSILFLNVSSKSSTYFECTHMIINTPNARNEAVKFPTSIAVQNIGRKHATPCNTKVLSKTT